MNRVTHLREQIDACRPGSDDLSFPALAELAAAVGNAAAASDRTVAEELDRSHQFDRAVVSALHDVPVPGDLLARLLAQAERNKELVATDAVVEANAPAPVAASVSAKRSSRRWLMAGVGLAALAASLVGLGLFLPKPARNVTESELAEAAAVWFSDAADPTSGWTTYSAELPPHSALRALPTRSRVIDTDFGRATVYDLSSQRRRAYLVVLPTRDHFAVGPLPFSTVKGATGGLAIGAWQSKEMLYVLVLDKDGQRLDGLLHRRTAA